MEPIYKTIFIYVDEKDNLIAIPTGESEKFGLMGLDIINQLNIPYTDEELESLLINTLAQCYSKKADDSTNVSSLERFLGVKGFTTAVKKRRLVAFSWRYDKGYYITPTNKIPKRGFVDMVDNELILGTELKYGVLARKFREAMKIATS